MQHNCVFNTEMLLLYVTGHTIVPRPLSFRPDFVTAGLVSFGTFAASCTVLRKRKKTRVEKYVKAANKFKKKQAFFFFFFTYSGAKSI